jgi:hypothetical protein
MMTRMTTRALFDSYDSIATAMQTAGKLTSTQAATFRENLARNARTADRPRDTVAVQAYIDLSLILFT